MKVFIVTEHVLHEGSEIKIVFSTLEAAVNYCILANDENNKWIWYQHQEWIVEE